MFRTQMYRKRKDNPPSSQKASCSIIHLKVTKNEKKNRDLIGLRKKKKRSSFDWYLKERCLLTHTLFAI